MDNVVALANTEKRVVALGLEDNGTVTGVGREHRSVDGLSVFIFFSKTVPQVVVRAEIIHADNGLPVACIEVDRNLQIVSSIRGGGTAPSEGGWNARGGDAVPEPVRQSPIPVAQLRLQRPAGAESRLDDWDPVARERLRDRIRLTNSGDTLPLLDDDDLDRALLMVVDGPYGPQPSLAGVLTIGKVDAIRRSMPMASEVFQVMKGASLAVNAEPFVDAVG